MAFMSDRSAAPFLLVHAEARSFGKYALEVVAKVARIANRTCSYTQINWEKLLATVSHYNSVSLSMQLKSNDSCARYTNRGYGSSSCCMTLLSSILTWIRPWIGSGVQPTSISAVHSRWFVKSVAQVESGFNPGFTRIFWFLLKKYKCFMVS